MLSSQTIMVCVKNPILYLTIMLATVSCKGIKDKEPAAIDVNVVAAGQQMIAVYTEYVGEVHGKDDIDIHSRLNGWVTGLYFKEGDIVKKGQLLYTIDDLPYKNALAQAKAKLAQANTLKAKEKADLDRVEPLAAIHALSARELDAANAAYHASESEVDAADAAVKNANIELGYTKIISPLTGIIGISKVSVGDYVGNQNEGAPLNTISSTDEVRVMFSISEDEYLKFAKRDGAADHKIFTNGVPVEIVLSDGTLYSEKGKIDLSNRQIDPATGSLLIQASFSNPKKLLRPGQYVKVRMQTDFYKDAILVPQQAVNQIQNIFQVFKITDSNTITPVIIKPGIKTGSNWIVNEGLKAGDKVAFTANAILTKQASKIKPNTIHWDYNSTAKQ